MRTDLGTIIGENHPIRRLQADARWTIAGFTAAAILIPALIIFAGSVVGPAAV